MLLHPHRPDPAGLSPPPLGTFRPYSRLELFAWWRDKRGQYRDQFHNLDHCSWLMAQELAEFNAAVRADRLGLREAYADLCYASEAQANAWRAVNPSTKEEEHAFYASQGADLYIADCLRLEGDEWGIPRDSAVTDAMLLHGEGPRVCIVGSGGGSHDLQAAEMGLDVTSIDVCEAGGLMDRWHKWRHEIRGLPLPTRFYASAENGDDYPWVDHFDIVVSVDVLEHVWNPKALFRNMIKITKPGGVIIHTATFSKTMGRTPAQKRELWPMHREICPETGKRLKGAHWNAWLAQLNVALQPDAGPKVVIKL